MRFQFDDSDTGVMGASPVSLGPSEVVPGRAFTAVELTEGDISSLHELLGDLRGVLDEAEAGARTLVPYQRIAWRLDGLTHRVIICDGDRLRAHPQLCVVGFFAERRTEVDIAPLEEANAAIVAEFTAYPGIHSYSSMELPGGHWANMVLHDDPIDTDYWRQSAMHANAVELLSPVHYWNVRIHNARLTAGLFDRPSIVVNRTKYFDYGDESEWRAVRDLAEAPA